VNIHIEAEGMVDLGEKAADGLALSSGERPRKRSVVAYSYPSRGGRSVAGNSKLIAPGAVAS